MRIIHGGVKCENIMFYNFRPRRVGTCSENNDAGSRDTAGVGVDHIVPRRAVAKVDDIDVRLIDLEDARLDTTLQYG